MRTAASTVVELSQSGFRNLETASTEHFASIGRFLLAVGSLDAKLNILLQIILQAEAASARAVIGEMRVGEIMQAIRRITVAREFPKDTINTMITLFDEINTLRNARDNITHKICVVRGNDMALHNALVAKDDASVDVQTLP